LEKEIFARKRLLETLKMADKKMKKKRERRI